MLQTINRLILTEPTEEPLDIDTVKAELGIDAPDHDPRIERLIKEARHFIEKRYGLAIMRQQWRVYLNHLYDCCVDLEPRPVQSIGQVQYVDGNGATQILATTVYALDRPAGKVRLLYDQQWPSTRYQHNAAWIDVWAGFFDPTSSPQNLTRMPEDIRGAMLAYIDTRFTTPGTAVVGTIYTETPAFESLMSSYWRP